MLGIHCIKIQEPPVATARLFSYTGSAKKKYKKISKDFSIEK
jgi:hypothetical protein